MKGKNFNSIISVDWFHFKANSIPLINVKSLSLFLTSFKRFERFDNQVKKTIIWFGKILTLSTRLL